MQKSARMCCWLRHGADSRADTCPCRPPARLPTHPTAAPGPAVCATGTEHSSSSALARGVGSRAEHAECAATMQLVAVES